jgi:hypothetical protein
MLGVDFEFKDNQRCLGVAYLNTDKRIMQVVEFEDNDYFSHLESLIIQLNSKEESQKEIQEEKFQVFVNMPTDESYRTRIIEIFNQCDIEYTIGNRKDFDSKEIDVFLNALLNHQLNYYEEETSKVLALGALC